MAAAVLTTRPAFASPPDPASGPGILEAVNQVFNTPELLENILLFLDLRTLLLSMRVSCQIKDTMKGSIKIQRALFLEPLSLPDEADIELLNNNPPKQRCCIGDEVHPYIPKHISPLIAANPLLDRYIHYDCEVIHGCCNSLTLNFVAMREDLDKLASCGPKASWRRMLVLQPHAAPTLDYANGSYDSPYTRSMRNGIRMDEFMKVEEKSRPPLWGAVQLSSEVRMVLGEYDIEDLVESWVDDGYDHRREVAEQICGWDVVGDRLGKQIKIYAPEIREPRE